MVEVSVRYEGELRCVAVHGPSDSQLTTDAPVDNHGKGESFSPTDLVATALPTCMLTLMGIYADARDISLDGATARVTKEMSAAPRKISRLVVVISLPATIAADARPGLEQAGLTCPVHRTLSGAVDIPVEFIYG